jgi:hypothetical protein
LAFKQTVPLEPRILRSAREAQHFVLTDRVMLAAVN